MDRAWLWLDVTSFNKVVYDNLRGEDVQFIKLGYYTKQLSKEDAKGYMKEAFIFSLFEHNIY